MKMKMNGGLPRRICAAVLAIAVMIGSLSLNYFTQKVRATESTTTLKIAALSDTHYYPINFVSNCEDYTTYVNGDPKLLKESGGILDAASRMVIEDTPDVLLISGDLTKDGEVQGHTELAAKLQAIQDACPKTQIYVINGNHDINNTDAWTFESGKKVSVESATPEKFAAIYSGFGYNADRKDTDKIQYYINSPEHPAGKVVGGLSYVANVNDDVMILALDSGMYSVDSGNGYDHDEHITGGKLDADVMKWATRVITEAQAQEKTVIGLMHHGLVPHFKGEEGLFSEYVVTDWEDTATQLADAGMRYIFTGHMHANDVAEYTTVKGNHITDVETGSLVSYGSPVRSVVLTKNGLSGEESFDISSKSVPAASYEWNGQTVNISNLVDYQMQTLYPENFLNNMLNGIVTPMLQQLAAAGDLKGTLEGLLTGTDLDQTILDAAHNLAAAGMNLNMGDSGTAVISYQNGAILLKVSGVVGPLVGGQETITDDELLSVVNDVLNQVKTKYINDPTYVKQILDELATELSEFQLGVTKDDGSAATLYDLVVFILTNHYKGHESAPSWVKEAAKKLSQGDIVQTLLNTLIPSLCDKVTPILQNLHVNFNLVFSNSLLKTTLNSQYNNGELLTLMNGFGFNLQDTVNGLIQEYMSQSFLSGMGQLITEIVDGMVYDSTEDDVLDGAHRVISYAGVMDADPQSPSVANGLLPSEVSMTFGADPETGKAFLWYTKPAVSQTVIRYSTSPDMSNAVEETGTCETVTRPKTLMNLGLLATYTTQQMNRHKVTIANLSAGTTYYYQVGMEGLWSEVNSFTTSSSDPSKFSALAVTDSQGMVASDYQVYENTFKKAQETIKDAEFTMNLGDMVDEGVNTDYWDSLTNNAVWRAQTMVPVTGNHEVKKLVEGVTGDTTTNQFNLDAVINGSDDETGVYYSFPYKNALFVVLNTNDGSEGISDAQYQWAENTLNDSTATWKIILMHKSAYSNGPHYNDDDVVALRGKLDRLCAETHVDLVLSGHDHVYNRTPILKNGGQGSFEEEKTVKYGGLKYTQNVNADGTVFAIIGTSGVKNYEQNTGSGIPSKVALQPNCPMFSGLTIEENALYFRAYTYDTATDKATLADSFSLSKVNKEEAAYEAVVQMIADLPVQITLNDKTAVEAARAAYNVLDDDGKGLVNNYQKLLDAEKTIATLESIAAGGEVIVTNKTQFEAALNNSSVTSIIVNGDFSCAGSLLSGYFNGRGYTIDRNLRIGGNGTITYGWFTVTNGAQLVLADNLFIDGSRQWGATATAITPVTVQDNSSVVLNDSAHVRTEYGSGSNNGHGIHLTGANSSAVINSNTQQWAASGAVYGENKTSSITINAGSFESKNWNSSVSGCGTVTVNGGDKIAGLEVQEGGTGYINGGTFTEGTSTTKYTPLVVGGTVYMTAGTANVSANTGKAVEIQGTLYMRPKSANAIKFGTATPYIGAVATTDFMNVSADMGSNCGINPDAQYDKLYTAAQSAADFKGQTKLPAAELATTAYGNTLRAQAENGTTYVFAKSQYYGGGRSNSIITGSGYAFLYNEPRTIENFAVTELNIENSAEYVLLQKDVDTTLNVAVKPDNAFNDGVTWITADERQTQITDAANGIVKSAKPGVTTITAQASAYPGVTDSIVAITLDAGELTGPTVVINGSTNQYALSLGEGLEDTGLHVKYSVDNAKLAEINETTGELIAKGTGEVKVTATAYYYDTELPVSKSMTVTMNNLSVTVNCNPQEGGTVTTDKESYALNETATLTATANDGYRFECWKTDAASAPDDFFTAIVGTEASYTTPQLTANASYTAVFAKLYDITTEEIQNGKVTSDVTEAAGGDKVTIKATPDAGYQLKSLSVSYKDESGAEVPVEVADDLTFTMPEADVVITAGFIKTPYNITIDPEIDHGTLSVSGQTGEDGRAVIGDTITVTVTPDTGYLLKADSLTWNDTEVTVDENGAYSFTMGAEDVFLTAQFVQNKAYFDLQEEIQKAKDTDRDGMTEESITELQNAIKEAEEQLVSDITKETAEDEIANLENAINNLKTVNFLLSVSGNGEIQYQEKTVTTPYRGHEDAGTEVTLTVQPGENGTFLYWQDVSTHRIITKEESYTFLMGDYKNLMAVFGETVENQYQVTFLNSTGTVLKTCTAAAGENVAPPKVPVTPGYEFVRWDTDAYTKVTGDVTVTAVMQRCDGYYEVKTFNGTVNEQASVTKQFDIIVSLKANAPVEGQKFAYWINKDTNAIISYQSEVSKRVTGDMTFEAIFVPEEDEVTIKPVVSLDLTEIDSSNRTVHVFEEKEVPNDCTIIEWGVIVKKTNVTESSELECGKAGVLTVRIARLNEDTQKVHLPFSGTGELETTSRGYVMYKDADGQIRYAYSDNLVHATVHATVVE